jgi:hypothetical protein
VSCDDCIHIHYGTSVAETMNDLWLESLLTLYTDADTLDFQILKERQVVALGVGWRANLGMYIRFYGIVYILVRG